MAQERRERWTSRPAFIMAAIGSAVGLGNLWRFPYVAFKSGGGAFFIPYLIALITTGIPLMIVEYALGQKYQGGAPKALAAVTKRFRWVGVFALLVSTTITLYYVVIMGYAWHYAVASWNLAWTKPAPSYKVDRGPDGVELMELEPEMIKHYPSAQEADRLTVAEEVRPNVIKLYIPAKDAEHKAREEAAQARRPADERIPVWTDDELARDRAESEWPAVQYVALSKNVDHYFTQVCLGGFRPDYWQQARAAEAEGDEVRGPPRLRGMFRISPNLALGAFVTWLLIFLIIFKGLRNVGRVVMLTVPLPVALLVIVLIRGVTLPGSATGLIYYLKPNWAVLSDPSVWTAAYGQIFFSLSLGFGILIAYASYMPPESDVTNSAFITSFGNCATSFLAGFAVFSVLGYLAYVQGQDVSDVVEAGPGLVFVIYPIALAKMPMATFAVSILSFLFFLCLITLGIDSAFSLVEGVATGFRDYFPRFGRATVTAVFCGLAFLGSLLFCTRSGLMWLDIVDNWMSKYGLVLVGLMECIAVGYFFHIDELKDYINAHSEIKVHNWFDAFIKVITPAVLIFLLASQFLRNITETYEGYDQILRHAVTFAGWGWFLVILVVALLLARHYVALGAVGCGAALFAGFLVYLRATSGEAWGALVAPAAMAAVGATILFGGLVACIAIAVRTHHMAGLSMEATEGPSEDREVKQVRREPGAEE